MRQVIVIVFGGAFVLSFALALVIYLGAFLIIVCGVLALIDALMGHE